MKKLLRNIAILLLPIVAYFALFIAFEPNNYFGLKEKADGTDIMAALRAYQKAPQNRIIIGESRLAKLSPTLIESLTGRHYENLAYGGASLKEQLDILDWAMAQNQELEEVVFMLSFYNLNQSYNHDRMVVKALDNPLRYMTNLGYNINMLTNLYDHLSPNRGVGGEGETENPADYQYVDYTHPTTGETVSLRKTMADRLTEWVNRSQNWRLNEEQFNRLLDAIADCEEAGIEVVVVLPPASDEVMEYVVAPFGIEEPMRNALAELRQTQALVLDYEFDNRDLLRPDQYYDGFHLDTERGLDAWTEILFADIANGRQNPREVA